MRTLLASTLALLTTTTFACGTDPAPADPIMEEEPPQAEQGVITMQLGVTKIRVIRNAAVDMPVTITRDANATGPITVTLAGLPAGVTAAPVVIPAGATTAMVSLAANADIAQGTFATAQVNALADDGADALASVELHLTDKPGAVDLSFATDGRVLQSLSSGHQAGSAIVRQPDGKLVVAGVDIDNNIYHVARYTEAGALDDSFAVEGILSIAANATVAAPELVRRSDGSFLLGTKTLAGNVIYALDADGHWLNDYGDVTAAAVLTTATFGAYKAMTVAPDGSAYVGGYLSGNMTVAHLTAAGDLDTQFDGDGIAIVDLGGTDGVRRIVVRPGGQIVIAGPSSTGVMRLGMAQLTTTGALDTNFSGDGKLIVDVGQSIDMRDMELLSDGRVALSAVMSSFSLLFVDGDGNVDIRSGNEDDSMNGIIESNGSIYTTGMHATTDATVMKFSMTGVIDPTFGLGGIAMTNFSAGLDSGNAGVIDDQGRLVITGVSWPSGVKEHLLVARFWL